ncbi:MAG: LexA family transcriptional regulator [Deltaproteobacteria bacterium]|nr:LexA family transcriptional regulator [Deltaproteobacteria bacterium]
MKNLGTTIRRLREEKKIKLTHLASKLGISYQYLSGIELEREHRYAHELIEKIAEALEIDYIELCQIASGQLVDKNDKTSIPVLGFANAPKGKNSIAWDDAGLPHGKTIDEITVSDEINDPKAYALIVKDNSMGYIERDWTLVVSPSRQIGHREPVIVVVDSEPLFRLIEIGFDGYKFYTAINIDHPLIVPKQDRIIIHKIWQFRCPC